MSRRLFLTIVSFVALIIGSLALWAPGFLLGEVKHATFDDTATVMARTVGIVLITVGVLNFAVRSHGDSETMRSVLLANLLLQIGLIPIDPLAYLNGTFRGLDSFVPNTILHVVFAVGFAWYLARAHHSAREAHQTPAHI